MTIDTDRLQPKLEEPAALFASPAFFAPNPIWNPRAQAVLFIEGFFHWFEEDVGQWMRSPC
jgi:hypothetical protein